MPPLGHMTADVTVALRALIANNWDEEVAANLIGQIKKNEWLDPEMAAVAANTIARKAEQVCRGPITQVMIAGTEGVKAQAIYRRAQKTYQDLKAGKSLSEITRELDTQRKETVEKRSAAMLGQMTGHQVKVEITKLAGGGHRHHPFAQKYYGFDTDVDVELTVDGSKFSFIGLAHRVIPQAVLENQQDILSVLPFAAVPVTELQLSGHTIINITVPAAVAAAMKVLPPNEAGKEAQKGAFVTAAIPGGKDKAAAVGRLALRILEDLE